MQVLVASDEPSKAGGKWRNPRLQTMRVADSLAAELRGLILRNGYAEGSSLPNQNDLAAEYGVSFPSVREALRILETEGLVTVRRGNVGGAEIRRPNADSAAYALGLALEAERVRLRDLAHALQVFEPACAAMCASREDRLTTVVPLLHANLAETELHLEDETAFTVKAREFHSLVVTSTGSATVGLLVRSLVALWTAQEVAWAESLAQRGEYFDIHGRGNVIEAHTAVCSKIESGDAAGAERLARRHITLTQKLFLERFNDEIVNSSIIKSGRGSRSS